jgi:hypothetical protein
MQKRNYANSRSVKDPESNPKSRGNRGSLAPLISNGPCFRRNGRRTRRATREPTHRRSVTERRKPTFLFLENPKADGTIAWDRLGSVITSPGFGSCDNAASLGQYPLLVGDPFRFSGMFFGVLGSHSRLGIGPWAQEVAPQGEPQDLAAIPGYYRTLAAMQCEDMKKT